MMMRRAASPGSARPARSPAESLREAQRRDWPNSALWELVRQGQEVWRGSGGSAGGVCPESVNRTEECGTRDGYRSSRARSCRFRSSSRGASVVIRKPEGTKNRWTPIHPLPMAHDGPRGGTPPRGARRSRATLRGPGISLWTGAARESSSSPQASPAFLPGKDAPLCGVKYWFLCGAAHSPCGSTAPVGD